jgi:serine/threonine-protein kinase SRPK3
MSGEYDKDSTIDWTGKIFGKNYVMLKKLGKGSFSSVWLAYSYSENNYIAIKIFNINDYDNGTIEKKNYDRINKLKSDNLMSYIKTFDYGADEYTESTPNSETESVMLHLCMVMKLMGCSTYDLIRRGKYKNGLPLNLIHKITISIVEGLNSLHKNGIIHTDIKPENILLEGEQEYYRDLTKTISDLKMRVLKMKGGSKKKKNGEPSQMVELNMLKLAELYKNTLIKKDNIFKGGSKQNTIDSISSNDSYDSEYSDDTGSKLNIDDSDYDSDNDSDNDSNLSDDEDEKDFIPINETFLTNPTIKLTDMGTCILDGAKKYSIQTRYYRAPEILMKIECTEKCDMWSLGCTLYELLTGKILFNPDEYEASNIDTYQLYLIVKRLGMIPKYMIDKCTKRELFFSSDKTSVRGYKDVYYQSLISELLTSQNRKNKRYVQLVDLIVKLLEIDPKKRISSKEVMLHSFFSQV